MFRVVLRHEFLLLRRSPAFWICAGLIVIVITGGAANGAAWAERQRQTTDEIERSDAQTYARIAAELDELPLPYHFDVKSFEFIKQDSLREHIQRMGIDRKKTLLG